MRGKKKKKRKEGEREREREVERNGDHYCPYIPDQSQNRMWYSVYMTYKTGIIS